MTREGPCGFAEHWNRTFKRPPIKGETATYYLQAPEGNFKIEEKDYTAILESIEGKDRPESTNYQLYKITIQDDRPHEEATNLTKEEYVAWRKKLRGY